MSDSTQNSELKTQHLQRLAIDHLKSAQARRLRERRIAHEYQEFDDGHTNVRYRLDVSLPKLARALGG